MRHTLTPAQAPSHGIVEILHFHPCGGLGGGAKGFKNARLQLGTLRGRFRCIGGFDNNPAACRDFATLAGVALTPLDLFSREQYCAFHGHAPPSGWREATIADIHRAAGFERPHVIFASMPCKGFSGLLPQHKSVSPKYQALNALALRGVALSLEAWADDPPEILLFENVPLIKSRGEHFLDRIEQLLDHYGYASAETTHDCGEIGKLSQSRKRFLLVARHREKVPPFLFEPRKWPLQPVSAALERCPLPGDLRAGAMHRVPMLNWRTWVRLAFVEAGKDWRCLQRLEVQSGNLKDFCIEPSADYHAGVYGVQHWDEPSVTVAARSGPTNGAFSIADPRMQAHAQSVQLGVRPWSAPGPTVTGQMWPGQGPFSVADPRPTRAAQPRNVFRIVRTDQVPPSLNGTDHPSPHALCVADPRTGLNREKGDHYLTAGHYGVVPWSSSAYAVTAHGHYDNGFHSVADPRLAHQRQERQESQQDLTIIRSLPQPKERLVAVIRALDGTWHRPFTTFELAVLQSLIDPEERLELDGTSDSAWRERIGNSVPSNAATAIAEVIGTTLLLAWTGETFVLGSTPIWVRDVAVALSVAKPTMRYH